MSRITTKEQALLKQFNSKCRADQNLMLAVSHRAAGRAWSKTQKRCLAILADEALKANPAVYPAAPTTNEATL